MSRITITFPDSMLKKVKKTAEKENQSLSYTVTKMVEIGLMVMESNNKKKDKSELEAYCQKLIIQINGILKKIAIDNFQFTSEKITQITNDTIDKFNQLTAK